MSCPCALPAVQTPPDGLTETALLTDVDPGAAGGATTFQLVPSQCSISCRPPPPAAHTSSDPSALAEVKASVTPLEPTHGTTVHAVPSQCQVTVWRGLSYDACEVPTTQASLGAIATT